MRHAQSGKKLKILVRYFHLLETKKIKKKSKKKQKIQKIQKIQTKEIDNVFISINKNDYLQLQNDIKKTKNDVNEIKNTLGELVEMMKAVYEFEDI